MKRVCVVFLFIIGLLQGCSKEVIFQSTFENAVWVFEKPVAYTFENRTNKHQKYNMKLVLKVNAEYPYRNIFIRFRFETPGGKISTSTPEFILADMAGNWHVETDLWGYYHFEKTVLEGVTFPDPGKYQFQLTQYMRTDSLKGIEKIGLELVPVDV